MTYCPLTGLVYFIEFAIISNLYSLVLAIFSRSLAIPSLAFQTLKNTFGLSSNLSLFLKAKLWLLKIARIPFLLRFHQLELITTLRGFEKTICHLNYIYERDREIVTIAIRVKVE